MSSLLQHLKKKHTRLEQQTAALVRQCRKHPLHEWRVEVKKWRYALRMLGEIDGQFPAKQFLKPYKTLFAAAGLIREIQIQRDLLRQTEDSLSNTFLLQYRNLLQQQYLIARRDFSETARRIVLPDWKMLKKPIQGALKQCTPLAYSWYFHQSQERITTDWHNSHQLSDEALHDLRKQLKSYDAVRRLLAQTAHYEAPPLAFYRRISKPSWNRLVCGTITPRLSNACAATSNPTILKMNNL
jgi:CHAD domain-containing protein